MKRLCCALAVPVVLLTLARAATPRGAEAVRHLPAAAVADAFAAGKPLLENPLFKIHASRREAPGMAEVHERDADLIYVIEGTATIVTGGTIVGGAATAPDEIRGPTIRGGSERSLARGDVLVIPSGVPHQFTRVTNPFLYYVVKVAGAGEGR